MTVRGGPQSIPRPDDARPGDAAPWSGLDPAERAARCTLERASEVFAGRVGLASFTEARGATLPAAVLALLHPGADDDGLHVLLTRRSRAMRAHRGEVAFPGGRVDPGETVLQAALREAQEEVALPPHGIEVLGELDHLATVTSSSFIVPLVAVRHEAPVDLVPNPAEVDAIRSVALADLMADGCYRQEVWPVHGDAWPGWPEGWTDRRINFFEIPGDTVWGATASMLRQLLALLVGVDATRTHP